MRNIERLHMNKSLLGAAALIAMGASLAFAQQKAPAEATAFATKVAAANTFEIQSSELATDRAERSDVKSFAKQMITDHQKAGQEFKAAVQTARMPAPKEEPDAKQRGVLKKLQTAKGKSFDQAYVKAQLDAHKEAVTLFKGYGNKGKTAPLKDFAQKTLPTLQHHLQMVQDLSKK
jgi:putative membrane protein